jgi:hypothetical protein
MYFPFLFLLATHFWGKIKKEAPLYSQNSMKKLIIVPCNRAGAGAATSNKIFLERKRRQLHKLS